MEIAKLFTGYLPRKHQEYLHANLRRFSVVVTHRRFGKSVFAANEAIDTMLKLPLKDPRCAYLAPTYQAAKRIIWDILKKYTHNLPNVSFNESELRVDIPRSWKNDVARIMLLGAENPVAIRGIYLDLAVLDEHAYFSPDIWSEVVRPALSDRLGRAIFISTPNGENQFKELYDYASLNQDKEWTSFLFKASQTGLIPQNELDSARSTMTEEAYQQEYECSWSAGLVGAYYTKELIRAESDGRITTVPYDRASLVHTFWDLGINDSTAIWFLQQCGQEIHAIDYIEGSGYGLDYYVKELRSRPYVYGSHNFPHDVAVRELSTGISREQTLRNLGVTPLLIHAKSRPEDRVHGGRLLIERCWFDSTKCMLGLKALRNYQRKFNEKTNSFMNQPLHNFASHGADAWGLAGTEFRPQIGGSREDRNLPTRAKINYNVYGYRSKRYNGRGVILGG